MEFATHLVEDLALRMFASSAATPSSREVFDAALWSTFCSSGLDKLLAGDESTALREATLMLRAAGFHAVRIPATEALLANWLAARAGWNETSFLPAVVTSPEGWAAVPWGRNATALYFLQDGFIARCLGPPTVTRKSANLAGEPRDEIARPTGALEVSSAPLDADELLCLAAVCRAAMIAGAMERALAFVVEYAGQRVQFGRPIGSFQAVQQMLAQLAAHAAAAGAAVDLAVAVRSSFTAAVAKSRASDAVGLVTEIAHQVVGAIGFTAEFPLHHLTRRLWAWREEDGSELFWNRRLGALAAAHGGRGLWPLLCGTAAAEREWQA